MYPNICEMSLNTLRDLGQVLADNMRIQDTTTYIIYGQEKMHDEQNLETT